MSEVLIVTLLGIDFGVPTIKKQRVFSSDNVEEAEAWFERLAKVDADYVPDDLDDYLERGFYEDANLAQLVTISWKNVE